MGALRVAVAGATGRMGTATCAAVQEVDDLELVGRAAPSLGVSVPDVLGDADVLVEFTRPDAALANIAAAVAAGVHVVTGTTGFDTGAIAALPGTGKVLVAPNFAIGAVLMMRFAAEASRHMARAEIIELHHERKLDAPSGTAARTAALMQGEVPIHSVRLPGLVANQEVLLGDVGQTLSIRHDTTDRTSFMPGVLLAIRRVAHLARSPVVGLEALLFGEPDAIPVRPAEQGDVAPMMALHERAWRVSYAGIVPDTGRLFAEPPAQRERVWRRRVAGAADGVPTWVAEVDGAVAGFIVAGPPADPQAGPDDAEVRALYVDPDRQGGGVGSALMVRALEQLAGAGYLRAVLWTLRDNPQSRGFYEAHGWRTDGAEMDEGDGPEVRYVRDLS